MWIFLRGAFQRACFLASISVEWMFPSRQDSPLTCEQFKRTIELAVPMLRMCTATRNNILDDIDSMGRREIGRDVEVMKQVVLAFPKLGAGSRLLTSKLLLCYHSSTSPM